MKTQEIALAWFRSKNEIESGDLCKKYFPKRGFYFATLTGREIEKIWMMENDMIDTTNFLAEWKKIEAKVKQIAQLKNNEDVGQDFTGFKINDEGIVYLSETYYCHETDWYYLFIAWDEINLPIEYFEQKFQKAIDERKRLAEVAKEEFDKKVKEEKHQEYLKLKKEFENYEKNFRE